ncbi:hypothetical protein [Stenotrophomonas bentonitica]|uniref:hypothetical protein n=1 Tax=Stenotrophomonas bentonitica TaxID=1450134 RepID=UPI003A7A31AB
MVKRGSLILIFGVAVAAAFFLSVFSIFDAADWTARPDVEQLRRANYELELPTDAKGESLQVFSKGTFKGASREAVTNLTILNTELHFADVAERHDWILTSRKERNGEVRMAYCSGDFSQIISLRRRRSDTAIFAATYWASDRSTDLYCRKTKISDP